MLRREHQIDSAIDPQLGDFEFRPGADVPHPLPPRDGFAFCGWNNVSRHRRAVEALRLRDRRKFWLAGLRFRAAEMRNRPTDRDKTEHRKNRQHEFSRRFHRTNSLTETSDRANKKTDVA